MAAKPKPQLHALGIYCSGPGHSNQTFAYVQRVSENLSADSPAGVVAHHPALYCHDHPKFRQAWQLMRIADELLAEGEAELRNARKRKCERSGIAR